MQSDCNDIQAHFTTSKFYSEPEEEVTFTNQSTNYHHCSWYLNNVLVSNSIHWSYTFPADGHYDVRLEVKDENETCTAVYEIEHHVHSPIHFCGDLELPDQDPSECPCMTSFDINEAGQMEQKTYYRWLDRWGNKYCNLSVAGECEDNMPFKNAPVPTPPPTLCDAGYFKLYFYPVVNNGVSYPTDAQQQVICQTFKDISILLSPVNPNTVVNFKINGVFDPNTATLASAGSYYDAFELNLLNNAIVHGSVWKAINTNSSDPNVFHGLVNVNGAHNFYTGYTHQGITAGQFDLYGIMQHEILHALGFASLITSYNGSSWYQQNNLYSTFDEHLLNNGTNVLSHNGSGTYTFNNLGNNCNAVKFNNMAAPNSPVNASMNGSFYSPSHFDDACTNLGSTPPNAINPLYVMNPSIAPNQARRLQQEEVSALCKMGYVISGNYGSPTLTVSGGVNPNIRPYNNCSNTNTGIHLSASNDNFLTYGQFYSSNCTDPINGVIPYTGPYNINTLLNNDNNLSGNAIIVDLTNLQTNLPVAAADLLPGGFSFAPTTAGIHQFSYRLYHSQTNTHSNIAIVSIYVTNCGLTNCQYPPEGCNLISNYEFERNPCNTLWSISHLYNQPNSVPCWRAVVGTVDFACLTFFSPTQINNGGYIFGWTTAFNTTEYVGQDIVLDPNKKYLASYYFRRNPTVTNLSDPGQFTLKMEYADQSLYPVNSYQSWIQPPSQQIVYETQPITEADHGIWKQAVNTFVNPIPNGNIVVLGANQRNASLWFDLDRVELIEDNFTAGDDQYISCNQSAILNAPCMDITNLQYAWYELDDMGNEIGAPIAVNTNAVVSPTVTTSYRLKRYIANLNEPNNNGYFVENANSLYAEDDVTVFVQLPSGNCEFSTSTNPNNCAIQFTSNNPYGAHFWDFGDGTTSTQVNPSHIFPNNGSYTVTHTIIEFGCECSYSEVIEVCCVITPIFNISNQLCQNINFSLPTTSTNGISGAWSPTFSSTNLGSTTYTFTPNFPCYPTTTMTITIIPCGDCNNAPGLHLSGEISGTLTPNQYRIVGDIEIHNSAVLNNCVFAIDPNRTITVHGDNPWNELLVFNSHFYGCHALWNGIDVKENGRLRITSSLVEDAKIAVNMQTITQQVNLGSRLIAGDVIFNKNLTGIKINGYPFSNPNQVFSLNGNVFTSRSITDDPNDWPNAADFAAANSLANANNAFDPFINASLYPASNSYLLMNANGTTTLLGGYAFGPTGILINNLGTTDWLTFNGLQIGHANNSRPEIFDRMLKGIDVQNSNLKVNFATFQAGYDITFSRGITANALTNPNFEINIQATANTPIQFYNLNRAIEVFNYTHLVANNLRIRSNRSSVGHALGTDGIYWKSYRTAVFETRNNQIHNIKNGIHTFVFKHNVLGISINISNNTIAKNLPSLNGAVPDLAIRVNGLSNNSMDVPYPELTRIISGNNISNVKNGIELAQFNGNYIYVNGNNITIAPVLGSPQEFYAGIRFWNVSTARSVMQNNNITGFSHITGNSKGIQFDNSSAVRISCNNLDNLQAGLYFNGLCYGGVTDNTLSRHKFGLWLNGGGVIGQQGNAQWPSGNKWAGAWNNYGGNISGVLASNRIRTYVSGGTNSNNSRLFVNPEFLTNPLNSWAVEGFSIPYNSSPMITTTNFYILSSPCATMMTLENEYEIDEQTALRLVEGLEQVADAAMQSPQDAPSEIIKEQLTYDHLFYDEALRDSVQVLEDFYYTKQSENIGKLRDLEDKIEEHDYISAEALKNQIVAENTIEQASKEVLTLYLKLEQGLFDFNDSLDLLMWAHSCYNLYGKAVLMAQVLHNSMNNISLLFDEDCPESLPRSAMLTNSREIILELFPNPNSDILYIHSNQEQIKDASIQIIDLDGKVILQSEINFENGISLTNVGLSSGVYIVEITFEFNNVRENQRKKLVYLR